MADFNIRSDNVDVEQIMRQIRARIREKRGVDYTEEEIRELANVKLEKFLDPRGVRSDLLQQYRRARESVSAPRNYAFEDSTLFESHRGVIRWFRKLLHPVLKLFFNPNPLIQALHIQSKLNTQREELDALDYEVMHNLVIELTRLGIEVKNLKMRLESMSSRLDFDERRARALEGVVQYRPGTATPLQPPVGGGGAAAGAEADASERRARRRRRRGRKRPGQGGPGGDQGRDATRGRMNEARPEPGETRPATSAGRPEQSEGHAAGPAPAAAAPPEGGSPEGS